MKFNQVMITQLHKLKQMSHLTTKNVKFMKSKSVTILIKHMFQKVYWFTAIAHLNLYGDQKGLELKQRT